MRSIEGVNRHEGQREGDHVLNGGTHFRTADNEKMGTCAAGVTTGKDRKFKSFPIDMDGMTIHGRSLLF
jgi:hypothetical protein